MLACGYGVAIFATKLDDSFLIIGFILFPNCKAYLLYSWLKIICYILLGLIKQWGMPLAKQGLMSEGAWRADLLKLGTSTIMTLWAKPEATECTTFNHVL